MAFDMPANDLSRRPQGRVAVGHPVDVASGTYFCAWHDVEIGGYAPLVLRRYFSTGLIDESPAGFGLGWTHNFALRLARTESGYLLRDQNGGEIEFLSEPDAPLNSSLLNLAASMELRIRGNGARIYHWHDWRTAVEVLWFERMDNAQFQLKLIAPPSGFGLSLDYDSAGRLSSVSQLIERRRLLFDYGKDGLIEKVQLQSPQGGYTVASYQYDSAGRLVAVLDALSQPLRYRYDQAGRMVEEAARSGAVFNMRYDSGGRCVSTRGQDGYHACKLQYALEGRLTLVTNSLGSITAFEFNGSGQIVRERRSNGAEFLTRYDAWGRIIEEEDPGGIVRYEYDAAGNTQRVSYPSGTELQVSYDADHQPLKVQQGSAAWKFEYSQGLLVSVLDAKGALRRYGYDRRGFVNTMVEPTGNTVRIDVDAAWIQARIRDDAGMDREEYYNDMLHVTRIVEPNGSVYTFDFDPLGRLIQASAPGAPPRSYAYDSGSCLSRFTDAAGFTTLLQHNVHGLIESIQTPVGRIFRCLWDTEGRLKTWINSAGEQAEFEHDIYGNETRVRHFDGRVESLDYDQLGRLVRRTLADGTVLAFQYDIANNLVCVQSAGVDLVVNEYDREGRLLATHTQGCEANFEYGPGEQVLAETQNGRRIEFRYNAAGLITARAMAGSPLPPLLYTWDDRTRLTAVRRGDLVVQRLSYDDLDRCVEKRFGRLTQAFGYQPDGRLASQSVTLDGRTLVSRSWAYDVRGNVVRIADQRSGVSRFEFDGDHRLTVSASDHHRNRYDYDTNGNIVHCETEAGATTSEYLSGNRLVRSGTRTYERDANGRVTAIQDEQGRSELRWNALGQLIEAVPPQGEPIRFYYDGLGRRARRSTATSNVDFIWAGEQLIAEISAEGTTEFLFDGFSPDVIWHQGAAACCVTSRVSAPLELIDELGIIHWWQRLDDWGNVEASRSGAAEHELEWRFAGQYADPTLDVYYNRFRYYDPKARQYLTPDPLGLGAGPDEFSYARNPVNWIDPLGLSCGIPPGQHTVYVLERGTRGPPPTPPTPPVVYYVGITRQAPHDRLSQHRGRPPGGISPDGMRVIASGPPTVPDRTAARLIEASALTHSHAGSLSNMPAGTLVNAPRPVNPGLYHSNIPSSAPAGTGYMPAPATNAMVTNNVVVIT